MNNKLNNSKMEIQLLPKEKEEIKQTTKKNIFISFFFIIWNIIKVNYIKNFILKFYSFYFLKYFIKKKNH